MKKLLVFLLAFGFIQIQGQLQSLDERVSYACTRCKKELTQEEISLALLMVAVGQDPIFMCEACRKAQKSKDNDALPEGQFQEDSVALFKPHLSLVSSRELDGGYRSDIRQMPVVQDYLRKQNLKKERIAVVTPFGYRVIAQRHGTLPFFFFYSPLVKKYELKELEIDLPLEEMTPLATNNILITTIQNAEGVASLYLYNPVKNTFTLLKDEELLKEMEKCAQIIEGRKLLAEWIAEIKARKEAKEKVTAEDTV